MADKGFLFFHDWAHPLRQLTGDEFKALFFAMYDFQTEDTPPPKFDGTLGIISAFVFPQLERRKASSEGGKRGMHERWKGNTPNKGVNKPLNKGLNNIPITQDKDKDIDKDIDIDIDTPPTPSEGESDERFTVFWDMYPRKEGKQNARKAWDKLCPDEELLYRILDAIALQKESDQWMRDNGRYIPLPASWLNGKRWEDEVKLATAMSFYDMLKDA